MTSPSTASSSSIKNFYDFTVDSFKLIDYEYEPLDKKFEVAI